ncbi:adenine deaminase isoform X2 [Tasmannia lanceolata]|uniref:adenine deaminase isoform X2 n=1 Tax=Tasmannia lanceolata TaxID=3420 RepID=UPI004063A073
MGICPQQDKVNAYSQGIVDGSYEIPLRCCPSLQLLKPEADAASHLYSLDVFPDLLGNKCSFPVTLNCPNGSSQGQDLFSTPEASERGSIIPHSSSQLTFLSFLDVPYPSESHTCFDSRWSCENYIDLEIGNAGKYSSCGMDIDLGDEYLETPKSSDETLGSTMRTEGSLNHLQCLLLWKSSLQMGRKIMQFLSDHSSMLLKYTYRDKGANERGHDTSDYRWRRYKRSVSIDSRKIALFFSILSSIGTMVLIYLTLRVKQNSYVLDHV